METTVSWVVPAFTPSGRALPTLSLTLSSSSSSVSSVAAKAKVC